VGMFGYQWNMALTPIIYILDLTLWFGSQDSGISWSPNDLSSEGPSQIAQLMWKCGTSVMPPKEVSVECHYCNVPKWNDSIYCILPDGLYILEESKDRHNLYVIFSVMSNGMGAEWFLKYTQLCRNSLVILYYTGQA